MSADTNVRDIGHIPPITDDQRRKTTAKVRKYARPEHVATVLAALGLDGAA